MSLDFLLEIGTEEIPHWMIPGALAQLERLDLLGAKARVDATPRRLVVQASGIPAATAAREEIVKGPPVTSGEKAAQGFARKHGAQLATPESSDLVISPGGGLPSGFRAGVPGVHVSDNYSEQVISPGGLPSGFKAGVPTVRVSGGYYELLKTAPGRSATEILAQYLPGAILGIQWPKTMYWTGGKTGPRFIRPIRWIVALLGDQVIPFEVAGVKAGNITRGHRKLGSSSILVNCGDYEAELRKNFVILSSHERRHKIETEAAALGAKIDRDLLETLTFITEFPTAIRGEFDPAYLELPAEVLTTVMRHHQKYFSVYGINGALAPNFVAVMNTSGDPEGIVKHGNERVLKARFNDARFFWNVDQQKKLVDRGDDLAHVTFQAKLGSYLEKTRRIVDLVRELGGNAHAQRAAELCKCDLTTEMVKEFTDLQGVIGGLYAKAQGEPEAVSRAIYEHYQPLSMEDSIPETPEGQIVALADKLDTLRGCFSVGLIPSGSKDPFALRRAAQGVVKILAEAGLNYYLDQLVSGELREFMVERMKHYLREVSEYKYDEVNAVLAAGVSTIADVEVRLKWLSKVRATPDFEPLAASFKRINNILKQANFTPDGPIDVGMLEAGPERDLYDASWHAVAFDSLAESIASLRPFVDRFFDNVMVNVPDQAVRANRLTLLHNLLSKFSTIADFSEIVTSGEQK
jgi:glycyl-tRNA synthetase beta chain